MDLRVCLASLRASLSHNPANAPADGDRLAPLTLSSLRTILTGSDAMTDSDLEPARFGTAFKAFMEAVTAAAEAPRNRGMDDIVLVLPVDERIPSVRGGKETEA